MAQNRKERHKFRLFKGSIRIKITMGLFIVFFVCAILMSLMMTKQNERRFRQDISNNMAQIWQNANTYSMQLMIAKHCNNDEGGFKQILDSLIKSMKTEQINRIYAFDIGGGSFHNLTDGGEIQKVFHNKSIFKLLMEARDGNANFMMYIGSDGVCDVRFVFPVKVAEKIVGILAIDRDYTESNKENNAVIVSTIKILMGTFAVIYIVTWILLGRWLRPLVELSNYSQDLTDAIELQPESEFPVLKPGLLNRRDEIGVLANDYENVSETIEQQFKKIEDDRQKILELMEDKQLFFNNVTHELKTPLTTIMGYSQLIREDETGDKELLEKGMKLINSESDRLYKMVLQLLEFAKVQKDRELTRVSLSELLMNVVSALQLKAKEENRDFVIESMSKVSILGNENELTQLYMNLIDNAIKYGKEKSPIMLGVKVEKDKVISTVSNLANPISGEELERIFEPFYRVDKAYSREQGSAGLGLSICKKIMEHHGGEIKVNSEENGVICFSMIFPKEDEAICEQ